MGAGRAFTAMSAARAGAPLSARRAVTPSKSFFIEILQKKDFRRKTYPSRSANAVTTQQHSDTNDISPHLYRHFASSMKGRRSPTCPVAWPSTLREMSNTYDQSRLHPH